MDHHPLLRFVRKTLLLYAAAILIFLPANLYAGQLKDMGAADFIRMLLFDGTFYHLWYLPASITGVLLLWMLGKKFSSGTRGCVQRAVSHFFPYKKRIVLRSGFSGNWSVVRAYFLISFLCFRISPEPEKEISYMRFPHIAAAPDL